MGSVHNILQEELHRHNPHQHWQDSSLERRWNSATSVRRIGADRTVDTDPNARVWKGSGLPTSEQGVCILGTPVGDPDFVQAFLRKVLEEHDVLLSRIPMVEDLQSAWVFFVHCAGGRANYMLRVVRPEAVQTFAEGHSDGLWSCLRNILGVILDTNPMFRDIATMLPSLGGMGLRNAVLHKSCGILGKLGRLPFYGPRTTPRDCHDDSPQDGTPCGSSHIGGSTNGCRPTGWCCRV